MALAADIGKDVWEEINDGGPTSNWLLLERGYEYQMDRVILPGFDGESELHPMHVTSWGEGARPVFSTGVRMFQGESKNIVFSDIEVGGNGLMNYEGDNVIFSDVNFTNMIDVQHVSNFTLHDSEVTKVTAPPDDGDLSWAGTKVQGMYITGTDGILVEGTLFHHNGWADGYRSDGSTEGSMAPTMFNHNVYLQNTTRDVTFRDNIVSQAGSVGAQVRGGGFVEDNIFLDNQVGVNFMGGDYRDAGPTGNFTLFTDNVITSGGFKQVDYFTGAMAGGADNKGVLSTLLDNIIAHLADPDNPDELLYKEWANAALNNEKETFYDDTIIYNWKGADIDQVPSNSEDRNIENTDTDIADQTTIQRFAAQLLGQDKASITELMDFISSLPDTALDDTVTADDIIAYFQNGFNVTPNGSDAATDHRFVPNGLGDGVRWDNRLNWSSEDLPDAGDHVDLGGNWVQYTGTASIATLDLGTGGQIKVNSGKLSVTDLLEAGDAGGRITTELSGQFWTDGYDDEDTLYVDVNGGRFANTGDVTGAASLAVSGTGEAILATDGGSFDLAANRELRIEGSDAHVGFDGATGSQGVFRMADNSVMTFSADQGGFSTLREFRSGAWDNPDRDVSSGVSLDGKLQIDVSGLGGSLGGHVLAKVDALDGRFDQIKVLGLAGNQNAVVTIDYEADELRLDLTGGTGRASLAEIGVAGVGIGEKAGLWASLTTGEGSFDTSPTEVLVDTVDQMSDFLL